MVSAYTQQPHQENIVAITVVEPLSVIDDTTGNIVVESDVTEGSLAIMELQGPATRRIAIMAAARMGLPDPRSNGGVQVYPVDADGKEVTKPKEQQTVAYRADVPVTRRLV